MQSCELPEEVTNTIKMHIDSQQSFKLPENKEDMLVQSNFATIIDEGSFVSVDGNGQALLPKKHP